MSPRPGRRTGIAAARYPVPPLPGPVPQSRAV